MDRNKNIKVGLQAYGHGDWSPVLSIHFNLSSNDDMKMPMGLLWTQTTGLDETLSRTSKSRL
jgi:uncharacterized protein involved in high-affinity Fe2+ transport